jgi:2-haloalkanoic acid dehalogenase type II
VAQKQLEYSWVRSLMGRYLDFWALTEQALDFALSAVPTADRSMRTTLLDAYRTLDCYPEVPKVLTALKATGVRLAILSNGSPRMLATAAASAKIDDVLDEIISVDAVRTYKTAPAVYDLVATRFRVFPDAVSFSPRTAGTSRAPRSQASAPCGSTAAARRTNTAMCRPRRCCRTSRGCWDWGEAGGGAARHWCSYRNGATYMGARFEWDPTKAAANQRKHGVPFEVAVRAFQDSAALIEFEGFVDGEPRWRVIGAVANLCILLVAHTTRNEDEIEVIRIISARPADRRERRRYRERTARDD